MIPTNDGLACIVASVPTERFDAEFRFNLSTAVLALGTVAPGLRQHLLGNEFGHLKAFRGSVGCLRQAHGPGWVLVGDAGFFRDPLTSHGISDALRDAEGVANAILSERNSELTAFQETRDSLARSLLQATDAIAAFDWSLQELPDRHKRFSEIMKSEIAVLSAREARDREVLPSEQASRSRHMETI